MKYIVLLSQWSGKIAAWLLVLLVITVCYDVFLRYFFSAPTKWAYDMAYMLYGVHFLLGGAYTLQLKGHVAVDFLTVKYSARTKAIWGAIFFLLFTTPFLVGILIYSTQYALSSFFERECSCLTMWAPPIYPLKMIIPVAFFLLFLQAIADFIFDLKKVFLKGQNYGA